jgi:hypothetical protein
MANLVVSALSTWDNKGLKKASKEISVFDKNVKKLGKTFAKTFAGYKLLQFGKASVNAFIASEKAAAQLRTTIDNLGLSYQQPAIADYIKKLELQYGIVDENLIPGFQKLLIATHDVTAAQSVFQTALDISAATGKDLTEVSTVLSKAYMGDTTALARLGIGISKTQLKGAKFLDVQKQLNATFKGQATAAASGYVGEINKLTVAVDQSKEVIGKGLLDALKTLSGDSSINTFTANMVKSAEVIAGAFNGIARIINTVIPGRTVKVDGKWRLKSELPGAQQPSTARVKDYQLTVKTTAARKAELAILTKSNTAKTAVDALKDKFDMERIQLTAALNAATDDETKLRIKAQLAILDNNEALAKKYLAEMEAAKAAKDLTGAFTSAHDALMAEIATWQAKALAMFAAFDAKLAAKNLPSVTDIISGGGSKTGYNPLTNSGGAPIPDYPLYNYNTMPQSAFDSLNGVSNTPLLTNSNPYGDYNLTPSTPLYQYNITIDATNMVDSANMTKVVQQAFIDINKNGYSTVPAGQGF